MGRVGESDTAFGRRDAASSQPRGDLDRPGADDEAASPGRASAWDAMRPLSAGGLYLNFAGFGEEKEELVRAGYGANYERLARAEDEVRPDQPVPDEPEHPPAS